MFSTPEIISAASAAAAIGSAIYATIQVKYARRLV